MTYRFLLVSFFTLSICSNIIAQDFNSFLDKTDDFLSEVVFENSVNYSVVQQKQALLVELTNFIRNISPDELTLKEQECFFINSYNLLTINGISKHYPITSTQKIDGFFKKIKYNIGGQFLTLDQIENQQLLPKFNDPRLHFVLNCGAIGCPPITNFAFRPENIDEQLNTQTRSWLNNEDFIYELNGKIYLSKIFSWYESDFEKQGGNISFINLYRKNKLNSENKIVFYPYDWSLNDFQVENSDPELTSFVQAYTPSKLLKRGQFELQLFNNLYTQTAYRDDNRKRINSNQRENYYTGLINILLGTSKNRRWNVGMDINMRSVKIDSLENSSPLKVLTFRKNDVRNRSAISTLGPVIKFVPFKNSKLSVKSSFLFPIAKDGESDERNDANNPIRPWFDWNRYTWWNQFFYDNNIGEKWQLFLEADLLFRFAKKAEKYEMNQPKQDFLDTPLSSFLSYFPSNKSTVYIMLQYSPRFGFNKINNGSKNNDFHFLGDFAQTGIGFKYQILQKLGLEISYTNFFTSQNQGAGNTFNLGVRYIN